MIEQLRDLSNRLRDSGRYSADECDLVAASLIDEAIEENRRLRNGLELAREWLTGWVSAEPYLGKIDALLGNDYSPQAPIARLQVLEDGRLAVSMYAPGLPPGEHDLYCEPEAVAPYLRDQPGESQ